MEVFIFSAVLHDKLNHYIHEVVQSLQGLADQFPETVRDLAK